MSLLLSSSPFCSFGCAGCCGDTEELGESRVNGCISSYAEKRGEGGTRATARAERRGGVAGVSILEEPFESRFAGRMGAPVGGGRAESARKHWSSHKVSTILVLPPVLSAMAWS